MKNKKVLVIVGPTATGKTSLAVKISRQITATLISADSRQVYKGMDIVTGKDHPLGFDIKCINLVEPDQKFSVASWLKIAKQSIKKTWEKNRLPIVVGGTGLYIKSLTQDIKTLGIPPNKALREKLESHSTQQLQDILQNLDSKKFSSMNNSDRNNPRRLIRAIEVAKSSKNLTSHKLHADYYLLGIFPPSNHQKIIRERVKERLKDTQAIEETQKLLSSYPPDLESFTGLGYQPIISYLKKDISYQEMLKIWISKEYSYAKSQLNWFQGEENINWLNQSSKVSPEVVKTIKTWYHEK